MVQEGLGITIWPRYSWRDHLRSETDFENVCYRPIDNNEFKRSLYLILQKDLKMTEELAEFCKYTEKYFNNIKEE